MTNGFVSVARTPSGRSATEISGLDATTAARSKAFSSSRTFPGQSWAHSASKTSSPRVLSPSRSANETRKALGQHWDVVLSFTERREL